VFLCFSANSAWAVDEAVIGDLSSDPAAPTPVAFVLGNNTVRGSVVASADTRDYITFTIPAGQRLTNLRLQSFGTNRSFHAINAGATSFVPSAATSGSFLGGQHVDPVPAGTDLLPGLALTPVAGTGFAIPLGPGTYSYLIQQTGPQFTPYDLEFVIAATPPAAVPALGPWMIVLAAGLLAFAGAATLHRRTQSA